MNTVDALVMDLPDPASATRFLSQFTDTNPLDAAKLMKREGLLSDALSIAAFSPLLATTLIQHPEYLWWLERKRLDSSISSKEELIESLARFSLTNSEVEPHVLFARFRRRELLRIFLRDIRRLATIAEITEEISNLADAILEKALQIARQDLDNRFGLPFEVDAKERKRASSICIVSLGKLGSKELNYSSDIDLSFIYSAEGSTAGGSHGPVTNREYFVKAAETVTRLIGKPSGEGAAYRVDLRLRPHGRVGSLAISLKDAVRYYKDDARSWERQTLIRSRSSAGDPQIFRSFFKAVENDVFSSTENIETALQDVYLSKEKINFERRADKQFDVKLGRGGIREIEFIAQALQLAHGGKDRWLRAGHTLISLSRLADRGLLTESELTGLFEAYDFLRHLEHIIQMENGLQTHSIPNDPIRRDLIAKRMGCASVADFENSIRIKTENVQQTFAGVFGEKAANEVRVPHRGEFTFPTTKGRKAVGGETVDVQDLSQTHLVASLEKAGLELSITPEIAAVINRITAVSPKFTDLLAARPVLVSSLKTPAEGFPSHDLTTTMSQALESANDLSSALQALRLTWSSLLLEIAVYDVYQIVPFREIKRLQSELAEASIAAALEQTAKELSRRFSDDPVELSIAVMALGKLGGGAMDYDSDLDILLVRDNGDKAPLGHDGSLAEFYSRAAEIFVTMLSGMTRDGNLYRVDLRLRPYGKNGPVVSTKGSLVEYIERAASIWELLAYVQLRGTPGHSVLAREAEDAVQTAIRWRAQNEDPHEIRRESRKIRLLLEEEHGVSGDSRNIDIKFGAGGLLDVYFVVRYLYLVGASPLIRADRSTASKLNEFLASGSLSLADHAALTSGYGFLSEMDHNIRLLVGRVSRIPLANQPIMERIADRLNLASVQDLVERLTFHRLNVRSAFDHILDLQ